MRSRITLIYIVEAKAYAFKIAVGGKQGRCPSPVVNKPACSLSTEKQTVIFFSWQTKSQKKKDITQVAFDKQ